jgi:hypothetical protein
MAPIHRPFGYQDLRHTSTGPMCSRIHGTYLLCPIGYQDPRHLSAGPLGSRIHGTYPPTICTMIPSSYPLAHWVPGSTAYPLAIGYQDPRHLSAGPLGTRIYGTYRRPIGYQYTTIFTHIKEGEAASSCFLFFL